MLLEKLVTTIAEMAEMKRLAPTCTAFHSPAVADPGGGSRVSGPPPRT